MSINPSTGEIPDDQFEECEQSGLPRVFCAHCKGDKLGDEHLPGVGFADEDANAEYERIGRTFAAQYSGVCTIDYDHRVKRGDIVSKVQRADNPLLPISGVACASCTKVLPHA